MSDFQFQTRSEREAKRLLRETDEFLNAHKNRQHLDGLAVKGGSTASFSDTLLGAPELKQAVFDWQKNGRSKVNFATELKADFNLTTSGGLSHVSYWGDGVVPVPQQAPTVRDLIPQSQTTLNQVPFMKESTFTNAATAVLEGALKPEASVATETDYAPVRKIAVFEKVSDELFEDLPSLRLFLDQRLRFMVQQREDQMLLTGTGVAPQMLGLITAGSGIQVQAKGADTVPDAIAKAIAKVQTGSGYYQPDAIVIHPTNYLALKLLKDTTGQFLYAGPYGNAMNGQAFGDTLWGLRVVVTSQITLGTALVGAFRAGAHIFDRKALTLEVSNSDQDDFVKNKLTFLVEERLALAITAPLAFCSVTGL